MRLNQPTLPIFKNGKKINFCNEVKIQIHRPLIFICACIDIRYLFLSNLFYYCEKFLQEKK